MAKQLPTIYTQINYRRQDMAAKKTKKEIKVVEPLEVDVGEEKKMSVTQIEVAKPNKELLEKLIPVQIEFLKMVFLSNNLGSARGPELMHEYTHKTDIELSGYDFGIQLLKYKSGQLYAQALDIESEKLQRTGLLRLVKNEDGKVTVKIPDWNLLMTALDTYYKMNGPY